MRFMIIRKADRETEAGMPPTEALISAMLAYNDEMIKAGVMLEGAGLQRSAKGARISFSGGKPTVVDGPFTETKELIAGYSIIEVESKDEAIAWIKRWPQLDGGGNVQLELRQLFSPEDFGEQAVEQAKEFERQRK
ncbi:MAG TPA: YciI family protein [Gemmatimonadaceae bacterium]|jgi:hypothetical protein|nr:YciI family protein [Gemmatimonadaceae bacterium]